MQLREQQGYTLIELVIVITVLAVIAAIAVPAANSGSDKSIDLAADAFATAMRFARSESIRTGEPYGFRQQSGAKRIRVARIDLGTSPATLVYDVHHPIDKQLYDIDVSLLGVDSMSRTALFRSTCNQQGDIYFDANGTPWCVDPGTALVETFEVEMLSGDEQRVIELDQITGRVTVR